MKQFITYSLFLFFGICTISAQEEETTPPLITDRPDATESPNTVPKGSLQIETGAFYTSFEENSAGNSIELETIGYNTTLLRYGLLKNMELRLGWNFEEGRTKLNGTKLQDVMSGFTPLLTGLKINVAQESF